MFLLNSTIRMNWRLRNSMIDIERTSLDVRVRPPIDTGGDVVYTNNAIAEEDFLAPTGGTDGWASYTFTPDQVGLWELVLTDGDENENTFYYERLIEVQEPDYHIRKKVPGSLI